MIFVLSAVGMTLIAVCNLMEHPSSPAVAIRSIGLDSGRDAVGNESAAPTGLCTGFVIGSVWP